MVSPDEFREKLEARSRKLGRRVGKVTSDLRRLPHPDFEEQATEAENDEVLEGLDASGREELEMIDAALTRIDAGTFGVCTGCGERIDERRLDALPHTPFCVACAP